MRTSAKAALLTWNFNRYCRIFMILVLSVALFSGLVAATTSTATTKITGLIKDIYCMLKNILPILVFTLMVLAGVAYGIGNFFGADTRAKAQGWGMTALTSGIIALIIYLLGPMIIAGLYSDTITTITCT